MDLVEKKVRLTIRKYKLFTKKQKIGVAVSGGKDSTSTLYILHKLGFNIEAIIVDHGIGEYAKINLENTKKLCSDLGVTLRVLSFKEEFGKSLRSIKSSLKEKGYDYSYCMICGILKRNLMNKAGREFGYDAVVTGHNLDDEAQAFAMNVFRNDFKLAARQGPSPGIVENQKFVRRVKPMYFVAEEDIKAYSKYASLPVNYSSCPYTKSSYRHDFKEMLNEFEKRNPSVKYNILRFQETMKSYMDFSKLPEIGYCEHCGEPSSRKMCKTCEIIKKI